MILLDTNVLVRVTDRNDPMCQVCRHAVGNLRRQHEDLILVPQVLFEFWAVATRPPAANGLGMNAQNASAWIYYFQRQFAVLPDHSLLLQSWHTLVKTHQITGFRAHDARLVAAMQTHAIDRLLTLNPDHFQGFPITLLDPASL